MIMKLLSGHVPGNIFGMQAPMQMNVPPMNGLQHMNGLPHFPPALMLPHQALPVLHGHFPPAEVHVIHRAPRRGGVVPRNQPQEDILGRLDRIEGLLNRVNLRIDDLVLRVDGLEGRLIALERRRF